MRTSRLVLSIALLVLPTLAIAQTAQQTRMQQLREINTQAVEQYLSSGMDPNTQRDIAFVLSSNNENKLKSLRDRLEDKGQKVGKVWLLKKDDKGSHYVLEIILKQTLADSDKLLKYSQLIDDIAKENQVQFIGWAAGK